MVRINPPFIGEYRLLKTVLRLSASDRQCLFDKHRFSLTALYPEWEKAQAAAARLLGDAGVIAVQTLHAAVERAGRSAKILRTNRR
jgi:hypothetical protein